MRMSLHVYKSCFFNSSIKFNLNVKFSGITMVLFGRPDRKHGEPHVPELSIFHG